MLLNFNIDKAISATGYLIQLKGGSEDMFMLVKKLYYADRSALIEWGQSITGDKLASLEKGPIVSGIYNLLKGVGPEENQIKWSNIVDRKKPFTIALRKDPCVGLLSEREQRILRKADTTISSIRGSIPKWLHKNCPEWRNPGNSSLPIDPSTILRKANKSEEEILRLEEANEEIRMLKRIIQAR